MSRYKIWDKKSPIYTIGACQHGKMVHTAEEYIAEHAAWAGIPEAVAVVADDLINGMVFMSYLTMKRQCEQAGVVFPADCTPEDGLAIIEAWEDEQNRPQDMGPDANERIAAALEFQNLLSM